MAVKQRRNLESASSSTSDGPQNIFVENRGSRFLFINKSAQSKSLSRSQGAEREYLFKHVQQNLSVAAVERDKQALQQRSHRETRGSQVITSNFSPSQVLSNKDVDCSQLFGLFVGQHIASVQQQEDSKFIQSFIWLTILPTIQHGNSGLQSSIAALAYAAFGQEKKDSRLIQASTIEYGKALRSVHASLSTSDFTIASCLLLIMYQFFSGHLGQYDWHTHIKGLTNIIVLRGPEAFQDGFAHTLFLCARSSIISAALNQRKSCVLDEAKWLIVPWENTQKTDYGRMFDFLALLPATCEFFEQVQRIEDVKVRDQQRLILIERLWDTNSRLSQWFASVSMSARPTALGPSLELGLNANSASHLFPLSYEFSSLARANMFRLFCASLVDIYNMLALNYAALSQARIEVPQNPLKSRCLRCLVQDPEFSSASTAAAHSARYFCATGAISIAPLLENPNTGSIATHLEALCRCFAIKLADGVCKSLQYCIKKEYGLAGRYLSVAPLKFAIWCYKINLPVTNSRLEWGHAAVKMLADSGISFSKNLLTDNPYNLERNNVKMI